MGEVAPWGHGGRATSWHVGPEVGKGAGGGGRPAHI
jgi:hypothetical protein